MDVISDPRAGSLFLNQTASLVLFFFCFVFSLFLFSLAQKHPPLLHHLFGPLCGFPVSFSCTGSLKTTSV